jgi:SNF family Na+-dependent transporter
MYSLKMCLVSCNIVTRAAVLTDTNILSSKAQGGIWANVSVSVTQAAAVVSNPSIFDSHNCASCDSDFMLGIISHASCLQACITFVRFLFHQVLLFARLSSLVSQAASCF